MRSKIGTKSRLAAHLLALALLILMLVYVAPHNAGEAQTPPAARQSIAEQRRKHAAETPPGKTAAEAEDAAGVNASMPSKLPALSPLPAGRPVPHTETIDSVLSSPEAKKIPAEQLRPPEPREPAPTPPSVVPPSASESTPTASTPAGENAGVKPVAPEAAPALAPGLAPVDSSVNAAGETSGVAPESSRMTADIAVASIPTAHSETVDGPPAVASGKAPVQSVEPGPGPGASENAPGITTTSTSEKSETVVHETLPEIATALPASPQPDESGALVVADSIPTSALAPLPNANLEVLGDGVYWLDPKHDLEKELAAIPEIGVLILLTPIPGYHAPGFDHIRTEIIPADPDDLTKDAARHFLDLTGGPNKPVVAAAIRGARGAVFFKGAYLIAKRNMTPEEALQELAPDLQAAGPDRDNITHRLLRLND